VPDLPRFFDTALFCHVAPLPVFTLLPMETASAHTDGNTQKTDLKICTYRIAMETGNGKRNHHRNCTEYPRDKVSIWTTIYAPSEAPRCVCNVPGTNVARISHIIASYHTYCILLTRCTDGLSVFHYINRSPVACA
jgi:hypothetical protein